MVNHIDNVLHSDSIYILPLYIYKTVSLYYIVSES